jgi:hypothetical protein
MSVTVQTVINNARTLLQDTDTGGIRWTDPELIAWLNEATAEVVRIHPEANSKNIDHNLVAGTKQRIPTDGVQLINVIRNVGVGGAPGRVIRLIDHNIMNNERPDWHMETPTAVATRFTFDHKDPFNFYVYPPNSGTCRVTVVSHPLSSQVTLRGSHVFLDCSGLTTSIDVTSLQYAFLRGCSGLTSINLSPLSQVTVV